MSEKGFFDKPVNMMGASILYVAAILGYKTNRDLAVKDLNLADMELGSRLGEFGDSILTSAFPSGDVLSGVVNDAAVAAVFAVPLMLTSIATRKVGMTGFAKTGLMVLAGAGSVLAAGVVWPDLTLPGVANEAMTFVRELV